MDDREYINGEDDALFLLIKKRDERAFSAIYRKYHPYLFSLALKYLKNNPMAEDAVQHVFVKLWETTVNINIEVNLKNYLYTMTKNYILNKIRDQKEVVSIHYMNAQCEVEADSFLDEIEKKQMHQLLRKGIDELPEQKREVCKLKMEENISNQEIADRMGISINTVKSHYQESVKMLRRYFMQIKMFLF